MLHVLELREQHRLRLIVARALLIVDIQRDYFRGGGHPLVEPDAAAEATRRVLDVFRASEEPVIHLQHIWDEPAATYMRPGTEGVEIHPLVAPQPGELVIEKDSPNGFVDSRLQGELGSRGIDELVVTGMESCMCIDATVRAALDLGFDATVVHDGCATSDLEFEGRAIPAVEVHGAFMAALADAGAGVVSADELMS